MPSHEFILASSNQHKSEELSSLLSPAEIQVRPAGEKLEVTEDGESFSENALKKAEAYYQKEKKPVLADDSGLVVEALPDELGIYSARFGGEGLTDRERAELLLKRMEGEESRTAYFVCVLCFYLNPEEIFFFEGRLNGQIAYEYIGEGGFGYDPVFLPEGVGERKTVAQVPEWKAQNSHRAQACKLATRFFQSSRE